MSTRESTDHQDDLESISNVSHTTGSTLQLVANEPTKAESISLKRDGPYEDFANAHDKKVLHDFSRLLDSVPPITENFEIVEKIGEGTFSSVYLAHIKGFPDQCYALKHIVPTSSPLRIENEIKCLQLMKGKDNVISLVATVRCYDQVVLVMPYFMHDKFADYLPSMTVLEARDYMHALFSALAHVHFHHIIHRDIKPSNFLYNRERKTFQLVDFGLAHFEVGWEGQCKQRTNSARVDRKERPLSNGVTHIAPPTYQRQHKMAARAAPAKAPSQVKGQSPGAQCELLHERSDVCDHCMGRVNQIAPRAGTPGFRAPEVLFKCPVQSTAVDIWSAGVILLSLLSGKYPFFKAHDDLTALAQVVGLLGSKRCANAAEACGKELTVSPEIPACNLRTLCQSLRASLVSKDLCDGGPSLVSKDLCDGGPSLVSKDLCDGGPSLVSKDLCDGGPSLVSKDLCDGGPSLVSKDLCDGGPSLVSKDLCDGGPSLVSKDLCDDYHMTRSKRQKLDVEATTAVNGSVSTRTQKHTHSDGSISCHGSTRCHTQDNHTTVRTSWGHVPESAYDLLHRCLDLDPSTRSTAAEALEHPFITGNLG